MRLPYKYEIYIPDRYWSKDAGYVFFSDGVFECYIKSIIGMLPDGLSGFSIRKETGYYKSGSDLRQMENSVLYFYSDYPLFIDNFSVVIDFIKGEMHQESVMLVLEGVAEIC